MDNIHYIIRTLKGHDNQYRKHSQLPKYYERNTIITVTATANFHLGSLGREGGRMEVREGGREGGRIEVREGEME